MPNGQIALARKPDYLDCATVELASLVEALRIAITGKSWRDVLCMLQAAEEEAFAGDTPGLFEAFCHHGTTGIRQTD